jgi:hypothetical protein
MPSETGTLRRDEATATPPTAQDPSEPSQLQAANTKPSKRATNSSTTGLRQADEPHHFFQQRALRPRSYLKKLLKLPDRDNALIEVNNLLASKPLPEISKAEVNAILSRYGLEADRRLRERLAELYKRYLQHTLEDRYLRDEELQSLKRLRYVMDLPSDVLRRVQDQVSYRVYKEAVDSVLKDGRLSEAEHKFLKDLRNKLELSDDLYTKIYEKSAQQRMKDLLYQCMEDHRISPEEESELQEMAKSLRTAVPFDAPTRRDYERYKLYWQIENSEEIPAMRVDMPLFQDERCYFYQETELFEVVAVHNGYESQFVTVDFAEIDSSPNSLGSGVWEKSSKLDDGTLYVTNMRLIFCGEEHCRCYWLDEIERYRMENPYITIELEENTHHRDRHPVFKVHRNRDILDMLLTRLLLADKPARPQGANAHCAAAATSTQAEAAPVHATTAAKQAAAPNGNASANGKNGTTTPAYAPQDGPQHNAYQQAG